MRLDEFEYKDSEGVPDEHREQMSLEDVAGSSETDLYAGVVRAALDAQSEDDLMDELCKLEPADRRMFWRAFASRRPECERDSVCDRLSRSSAPEMAQAIGELAHDDAGEWSLAYCEAREDSMIRTRDIIGSPAWLAHTVAALGFGPPPSIAAMPSESTSMRSIEQEQLDTGPFLAALSDARSAEEESGALLALLTADSELDQLGRPADLVHQFEVLQAIIRDLWRARREESKT